MSSLVTKPLAMVSMVPFFYEMNQDCLSRQRSFVEEECGFSRTVSSEGHVESDSQCLV